MRRNILVLIAIMILAIALVGCGNNNDNNQSNGGSDKGEVLKVGLEAGYPPFNWTQMDDSNGAVPINGTLEYAGGYDVEIAKRIAEGLGRELVIEKIEWDGLLPAIESGIIDVIIAGMSPTADRAEVIDFTDRYYKSDLVMVVRKGGGYEDAKSIHDFSGAKITAQQSTFHYTVIDQIDGVIKETAMSDFPAMRVALESGIIDGYVSERPEGISASAANENFVMVVFEDGFEASDEDTAVAVGVAKGSELTEEINKVLAEISEDERQEIMDQAIINQPAGQ